MEFLKITILYDILKQSKIAISSIIIEGFEKNYNIIYFQ